MKNESSSECPTPFDYRVSGMNIFEWRSAYRNLSQEANELKRSYDYVVDEKRNLTLQLEKALSAKSAYTELCKQVVSLQCYLVQIMEIVDEAIQRD